MAHEAKTTINHKKIKAWAEARDGKPVSVKGTEKGDEVGVLRIDFPGYSGGDRFEEISWEAFFKKFDENHLAFLYQEHTADGSESRFCKLVHRDDTEHKSESHTHKGEEKAHKVTHK